MRSRQLASSVVGEESGQRLLLARDNEVDYEDDRCEVHRNDDAASDIFRDGAQETIDPTHMSIIAREPWHGQ